MKIIAYYEEAIKSVNHFGWNEIAKMNERLVFKILQHSYLYLNDRDTRILDSFWLQTPNCAFSNKLS